MFTATLGNNRASIPPLPDRRRLGSLGGARLLLVALRLLWRARIDHGLLLWLLRMRMRMMMLIEIHRLHGEGGATNVVG